MKQLTALLTLVLAFAYAPASAQDAPPARTTAGHNFDAEDAKLPEAENCTVTRADNAAAGAGCLKISIPQPMTKAARVTFGLGRQEPLPLYRALQAHFRCTPTEEPVSLRWYAEDSEGRALFQRKFSIDNGAVWTQLEFPFALWRWGNDYAGDWMGDETRRFTLAIESDVSEVFVDEINWVRGSNLAENNYATAETYEEFAFGNEKYRHSERGGFRIATDGTVKPQDFDAMHVRFGPIVKWLERVFGQAADPTHDGAICVLIFSEREGMARFCKRLGTAWRATITPPTAGGYTVQDVAMSCLDDSGSFDRPVFFHEAVHAAAARYLRLIPGHVKHGWLQEGIANYLQLCLFPESLGIETYPKLFKAGIGARTTFVPLKTLLTSRTEMQHYAQLAALAAWLVEKHPDWLQHISGTLTLGDDIETALKKCETDFESMQKDWLAWGQETFKEDPKREVHFAKPAEWK